MELARRLQEQYDREAAMQRRPRGRSAEIVIPHGARPGQALVFMDGGTRRTVFVPQNARPGDKVSFPIPQAVGPRDATRTVVDLNTGSSYNNNNIRGLRRRDAGHYQGGLSEEEAVRKAIEESKRAARATVERRRASMQKEKGGMAPAVVKREGYRRSVYMTDQTPCAMCEGELMKKSGLSTKRVYCRLNNSYLNYYTGTKQNVIAEDRMWVPDGSYNLQRIFSLKVDSHNSIIMCFHGGITKTLTAASPMEAKRWYKCIEERRLWFRDITTAAESREKLKQAQERQQFEIQKQVENLSPAPVGVSVGEKESDESESSSSESEQEDLDLMQRTAPVVGEIPVGGIGIENRDGEVPRRLSQFDPFADEGNDDSQEATTPGTSTAAPDVTRRLSQFDPFAEEEKKTENAPTIRAPPPSYDSSIKKEEEIAFDPFASSTLPVRQSSFDPFADIGPAETTIAATTATTKAFPADPFADIPSASTIDAIVFAVNIPEHLQPSTNQIAAQNVPALRL